MPKVETSTLTMKRGHNKHIEETPTNYHKNCVSNYVGKHFDKKCKHHKLHFDLKQNAYKSHFRFKRDLIKPHVVIAPSLPKHRVIKKLIRIEPIYKSALELNSTNKELDASNYSSLFNSEENKTMKRHYRKRVVVRKRPIKPTTEMIRSRIHKSTVRHQKKIVITRKRLLQSTSPVFTVTSSTNTYKDSFSNTENSIEDMTTPTPSDYKPFFPEISVHNAVLPLKTIVLSSTEYETMTIVQSRLRTFTLVVTRVSGNEQIVTSTTEVKPQLTTLTITKPRTKFTTVTILDLEETETLPFLPFTVDSSSLGTTTQHYTNTKAQNDVIHEEARYNNLATRIMSNGVEVIVAGDKSTLPGEPDIKRILPSSIYKPVTLKPSTLSDHMMMLLPQDVSNVEVLASSLHPNQFVTKTCLTTFTYLTTYLENGSTILSSHEQVVSNIATEERNSIRITQTPNTGITLTQHPNLAVETFLTTYTYFTTLLDEEQPLVVTSRHTVTNTVTAPDDYLSLLKPPKKAVPIKDTNTYFSTVPLQKTLFEGKETKVIRTNQIITQVVITESIPSKATSVMTSYIALDMENPNGQNSLAEYSTTDMVKTYYVTYTYYNTYLENGKTVVKTNVSTSSDVVTEKLFLQPKRTQINSVINTSPIKVSNKKNKPNIKVDGFEIHATKTYITTFTYYTTLLQEHINESISTIISSHTTEIENVRTETIEYDLLNKQFLTSLHNEIKQGSDSIVRLATLHNGQKLHVTAVNKNLISPTKVLPIEKTFMAEPTALPVVLESSTPSVITGSTIIFFDDLDQSDTSNMEPTPTLNKITKIKKSSNKNDLNILLSSEIIKSSQISSTNKQTSKGQTKRHTNKQSRLPIVSVKPSTSKVTSSISEANLQNNINYSPDYKKKSPNKAALPITEIPDLLGLGSINMNTLHVLKPVINAMAGLIKTNLKGNIKNESSLSTSTLKYEILKPKTNSKVIPPNDNQNRAPIYIPIGTEEDGFEIAESQRIATIHINEWRDETLKQHKDQVVIGKVTHESPLLNGGIPISPGQVITANSDVIVGKPGRIGPRIPSIPINKESQNTPLNMKPPPIQENVWLKHYNDKIVDTLPSASLIKEKPDLKQTKDDYSGPPPPFVPPKIPLRPPNFVRGEKYKNSEQKRIPLQTHYYEPTLISKINDNTPSPQTASINTPFEHPTIIVANQIHNFNIQPSVVNKPIVLPEVVERSTGQPLLVNLQPSQIAFVNIPHNRTTALIYGGSTEPHRNGQYFDDPSPYPEPEFAGIENLNNGIHHYTYAHDNIQTPNQKQVEGVIKVATNIINNNPLIPTFGSFPQIHPTKPEISHVNVNAPPISFGVVNQGSDINAHIISHEDVRFRQPPTMYNPRPNIDNQNVHPHIQANLYLMHQEGINTNLNENIKNLKLPNKNQHLINKPHLHYYASKHRIPQTPSNLMMERLKPHYVSGFPSNNRPGIPIRIENEFSNHQHYNKPHTSNNNKQNIGISVIPIYDNEPSVNLQMQPEISSVHSFNNAEYTKQTPLTIPLTPQEYDQNISASTQLIEDETNDLKQDDLINEAGEVIQESNTRPLRPGQIPTELLMANLTRSNRNKTFIYPSNHEIIYNYNLSVIQNPRPFGIVPVVRPENHQSNQVNQHEYTSLVYQNAIKAKPENQVDNNQVLFNSHFPDSIYTVTTKVSQNYYNNDNHISAINKINVMQPPELIRPIHSKTENDINTNKLLITTYRPTNKKEVYKNSSILSSNIHTLLNTEIVTAKPNYLHKRPYVTSMPVNNLDIKSRPIENIYNQVNNVGPQTETPFNISSIYSSPFEVKNTKYMFSNDDVVTDKSSTESITISSKSSIELSTISPYEFDMEIMKPPPVLESPPSKHSPPIKIYSPGDKIYRVPSFNRKSPNDDLEGQESSPSPYTPRPINSKSSPKLVSVENVMGMSPPPPITTYRPILQFTLGQSTHKPLYPFENGPVRITTNRPKYPFETSITTLPTRRRRPYTRPTSQYRMTTSTIRSNIINNRPNYSLRKPPISTNVNIFKNYTSTTTESILYEAAQTSLRKTSIFAISPIPTSTQSNKKVVENVDNNQIQPASTNNYQTTSDNKKEIPSLLSTTKTAATSQMNSFETEQIDVKPVNTISTVSNNFTRGLHHAGNEIKIIDESVSIPHRVLSTITKLSKSIIPTRYITHTKTSTVTITKTTVVKTLGGPPSTLTILVTKTEKSTVIDTVTEVHTLVKPTNIIETITTTINQISSTLYPSDASYGNNYATYPTLMVTPTLEPSLVSSTSSIITEPEDDDLDKFIIHDTEALPPSNSNTSVHIPSDNDSFFVVMTDKKNGEIIPVPEIKKDDNYETQNIDEVPANNEVNRVLLGGILIASPPSLDNPGVAVPRNADRCAPECKASKNELCQKVEGIMRCVCRPGFARMFPDRPCKPTYTYSIKLVLKRHGKEELNYEDVLGDSTSPEFTRLAAITHEALDRMVMQSDLRDIYHGIYVQSYQPVLNDKGLLNNFYLQLSDNTDEQRLKDIFKKYLRNNNYSLGGTELYASKDFLDKLTAEDFDECTNLQFHDCSEYAHCFNLPGTYTCSCKEGYSDLSENSLYPGRLCSAELIGCEKCHYHGTCYTKGEHQVICECFQWYAGEYCHINLKVLLIALVTLGTLLFILLLVCIILTCAKRKPHKPALANSMSFMPQRLASHNARHSTMDRRAMIHDSSSEGSQSDINIPPYVAKKPKKIPKGALKKTTINIVDLESGHNSLSFPDQKDRSLPVMIPRAKYHPASSTSPHLNMESFNKRKVSASSNETKLLSYLDAGPSPDKMNLKPKHTTTLSDSLKLEQEECRKLSGALVSAGFEVSATVGGGGMGTLCTIATTCGTEADRSENATLIHKISTDLLSTTGTMSQFTTFRKSHNDIDDQLSNWLDIPPKLATTVSEARSYDETTIQAPTKSFRNGSDSKPSSQHQNDEANTMAERDVGSTFLLPHTHLYKPDRDSDISGFDSL